MVADTRDIPELGPPLVCLEQVSVDFGQAARVARYQRCRFPRTNAWRSSRKRCGKTVLLKTIIGLLRPTRRSVRFDGQRLAQLSDKDLTQQRTRSDSSFSRRRCSTA